MRKTNFVAVTSTESAEQALINLQGEIDNLLANYKRGGEPYHDAVISPAQMVVVNSLFSKKITAYSTVYLPSADDEP